MAKTSDPDAVAINGVKPVTFFINDTENKLRIYRYDSIAERKTASEILRENDGARFYYSEPKSNAKNIMCLLIPRDEKEYTREDGEVLGKVIKTVFEKLNDTQEIVYTGRGENWESKTVVKYYEYFFEDEDATLNYENWHEGSTLLTYLGKDIDSVGVISYERQGPTGGGSGTGVTLDPDGTVRLGSGGGNGSMPRADTEVTFTIRWNDREETFTARAE
ncbi:MAG: hypothetical protein U9N81_00030 [Bacillota bacterium]|nr:hypothetical protein [Bacillota bacterium]